jgi:hypothetical protein
MKHLPALSLLTVVAAACGQLAGPTDVPSAVNDAGTSGDSSSASAASSSSTACTAGEPRTASDPAPRDVHAALTGSRSRRGTEVASLFYSLLETAKLLGINPARYLREAALADARGETLLPSDLTR